MVTRVYKGYIKGKYDGFTLRVFFDVPLQGHGSKDR